MNKARKIEFDAVIVGGGGSGMRAALQLAQSGYKTAVITKVFPTRSHTVSAQGGITCAIASEDPNDQWQWHMYDTVKGSDYIGDQEAIEYMCQTGPQAVFEVEHMGLPFSRNESGRIYQRPFGGQSKDFGNGGQAARTCAAADRTGHAMLHALYQQSLSHDANFFIEYYVIDLIVNDNNECQGVLAWNLHDGKIYVRLEKPKVEGAAGSAANTLPTDLKVNIPTILKTFDLGKIKQSFSHGRSRSVSVEVKKKRSFSNIPKKTDQEDLKIKRMFCLEK